MCECMCEWCEWYCVIVIEIVCEICECGIVVCLWQVLQFVLDVGWWLVFEQYGVVIVQYEYLGFVCWYGFFWLCGWQFVLVVG